MWTNMRVVLYHIMSHNSWAGKREDQKQKIATILLELSSPNAPTSGRPGSREGVGGTKIQEKMKTKNIRY